MSNDFSAGHWATWTSGGGAGMSLIMCSPYLSGCTISGHLKIPGISHHVRQFDSGRDRGFMPVHCFCWVWIALTLGSHLVSQAVPQCNCKHDC